MPRRQAAQPVKSRGGPFAGADGHLDMEAVIDHMIRVCPALGPILQADEELIGGLPCIQASRIAEALVKFGRDGDTDI